MTAPAVDRRNPFLAFGLSAVLPGAGQVYNRDWIKAGIGIALEAALWTGYVVWRQEGLQGRDAFQAYAHAHFSPVQYARWLNTYPGYAGAPIETQTVSNRVNFKQPVEWTERDRQLVHDLIDQIQAAERNTHFADPPHATFSHVLPHFGEQQYYELIGKYYQYAPGWDDCGQGCNEDNPSDRFFEYARMHGRANMLLRHASRITALVLVNHGLAAFDALISAQLHNNKLDTSLSLQPGRGGGVRPYVTARLSF